MILTTKKKMVKILDMQFMRYANLFDKITKIKTKHCFNYNNTIVFAVPRKFVMRAIGPANKNLRKLNEIIGKKIKIVPIPNGREDIENFVLVITNPVKFRAIEIKDDEAIINATSQSKAALIGRNKVRLEEMENILRQYFGIKKLRVK
jgi:NusA-like KH domain protein